MVEPRKIVREILEYIRNQGIVAGGAIRDIVLGRIPKDYDVFVFHNEDFDEIIGQKGIFDKVPERAKVALGISEGYNQFSVWNTTLHGERVQLIWSGDFQKTTVGRSRSLGINTAISPQELVEGFPYTINMMYVDHHRKIQINERAKRSLTSRQLIYNDAHRTPSSNHNRTAAFTIRRGIYLAEKLGFKFGIEVAEQIFEHLPHIDELNSREWIGKEIVDAPSV